MFVKGLKPGPRELAALWFRDVERGPANSSDGGVRADLSEAMRAGAASVSKPVSSSYDQDEDAGRSEAERELLAALRSVR